jgi:hypothetical protein
MLPSFNLAFIYLSLSSEPFLLTSSTYSQTYDLRLGSSRGREEIGPSAIALSQLAVRSETFLLNNWEGLQRTKQVTPSFGRRFGELYSSM